MFPYQPRINNPNENARFYMTAAIVEEGTYVLDSMRERWGWVNDCAIYEGHAYSVKAPGTSLLGVVPYAGYYWGTKIAHSRFDRTEALWFCRVFASILPWLVFLFFFYRWLGRHTSSELVRDAVFVSVALGSCLYGYGMLFLSHTLSAATAFGAFMLLVDAQRGSHVRNRRAFAAGLLTAGVTLLEYPGIVVSLLLSIFALFALRPKKRLVPFALGGIVPAAAMMHFQWMCFGSPFTPGHLYMENPAFRTIHEQGFFGATGIQDNALGGLLVHPGAGLFPLTPILAFAVIGFAFLIAQRGRRIEGIVALSVFVLTTLAIATMTQWRGGWTIGPRYLVLVYPFLAWAAVVGLEPLVRRAPRAMGALAIGTTAVGILLSGAPSVYYPHLPEALDRPVSQLIRVLVDHDFAPYAAPNLFGVHGTWSMVPLALVAVFALGWIAWSRRGSERAVVLAGAAFVATVLSCPLLLDPHPFDPEVRAAVRLIARTWVPAGHDDAALLEARLSTTADADGYRRLAEIYDAEGRDQEAQVARARAAMLERSGGATPPLGARP